MAAADLISLGIGSPAGIRAFILFGLSGSGGASDTTPDAFSGETLTGQPISTTITFTPVTPSGYDSAPITVVNGLYSINGGSYVSTPGTLNSGDTFTPRNTSSGSYLTDVDTTITVGGVSAVYRSTTRTTPAAGSGGIHAPVRVGGMMTFG